MKYLLLVYGEEALMATVRDADCKEYSGTLIDGNVLVAAEALERVETATTVRVRSGEATVTDGPFAETKEQLAGFYLVDAEDLDHAVRIASGIPPARIGSIEIRPVRELKP
jgi:hypothetical protein